MLFKIVSGKRGNENIGGGGGGGIKKVEGGMANARVPSAEASTPISIISVPLNSLCPVLRFNFTKIFKKRKRGSFLFLFLDR